MRACFRQHCSWIGSLAMARPWLFNVAFLLVSVHLSSNTGSALTVDPIRKVLTMLLTMKTQVEEESANAEKLYSEFMCGCKVTLASLQSSIDAANTRIPQLESGIKEGKAEEDSLNGDIDTAKKEKKEAEDTLQDATALRDKEAKAFQKEADETAANIKSIGVAVTALEKGLAGSFLQTSAAMNLRRLVANMDISSSDRDVLSAFLAEDQSASNAEDLDSPPTMEIVGILKQMSENMDKELAENAAAEKTANKNFNEMKSAKDSQIEALKTELQTKNQRLGQVGVSSVALEQDLGQTTTSLEESTEAKANKNAACDSRMQSHAELRKTQSEEVLAIAETIKIINGEATAGLFKKNFPGPPSFLQIQATSPEVRREALKALQKGRQGDVRMELLAFNIRSKKTSFDKVLEMIDKMRALLVKEQKDDTLKKNNCEAEIQKTDIELRDLKIQKEDLEKELQAGLEEAKLTEKDIDQLAQSVRELDKQVADAAKVRKEENQEYLVVLADNGQAKDILDVAQKRLQKFYTKFLQTGSHSVSRARARPVVASLFEEPNSAAPSFTQVFSQQRNATTEKDRSSMILNLLDTLMADIEKDMQENKADEFAAQKAYTILVEDCNKRRATDAQTLSEKEALKASLEAKLHKSSQLRKSKMKTSAAKRQYLEEKHEECDDLLENFQKRKDARETEGDALLRAKAVLQGADGVTYGNFVQISSRHRIRQHAQ